MKLKNKKTQIYLMIILIVAILIGIGYAYLSSNLNILGNTTINKNTWDIHLENLSVTDGSITATTPAAIDSNSTTVNFTVKLTQPGDYYEFTVDELNAGTIDGMISSIVKTGLTESQAKYLNYTVTYTSGVEVAEKQLLASNKTEKIIVRVEFKKNLTASDLPTTDTTLDLSFGLNYIQADESAVAVVHPVCKRADTLHNDGTYEYGNLGTAGTLTSGDAFDCDVNGDGVYDSETERFYYVSDYYDTSTLTFNSDYATLIYYVNIANGEINPLLTFAYAKSSADLGPTAAIEQLPVTSQWPELTLYKTNRTILTEDNVVKEQSFDYSDYVARLLTYQEVYEACYDGTDLNQNNALLSKCEFLLENVDRTTGAGYWLETRDSSISVMAWHTMSTHLYSKSMTITSTTAYGIRPVIEISKTKINY